MPMAPVNSSKPWFRDPWTWLAMLIISPVFVWMTAKLIGVIELKASDWAAWVQAVGSITAIVAAAVFVNWQNKLELLRAREAEIVAFRGQLQVALWLSNSLLMFFDRVQRWLPTAETGRVRSASRAMTGELLSFQAAWTRLDPTAKGGRVAEPIAVIGATIGTMIEHARNIHEFAYAEADGRPQFIRYAESRSGSVERARNRLLRVFGELPSDPDSSLEGEVVIGMRDGRDWY